MTQLNAGQIKGLAQQTGFTADQATVMTALALAESDGNPNVHNIIPPDNSYGLWQINMRGSMGPANLKKLGLSANSQLYDPGVNAVAARMIYAEQGYKAWSTYGGPKYRLYLPKAKAAVAVPYQYSQGGIGDWWKWATSKDPWGLVPPKYEGNIPNDVGGSSDPIGGVLNNPVDSLNSVAGQVGTIASAVVKAGNWLSDPASWLRIVYVAGGAAVLVFAMQSLFKPVAGQIASSALKVIPQAKAIKKVVK